MRFWLAIVVVLAFGAITVAQDKQAVEPVPADLFLSDLKEAYAKPFADEVVIRLRTPSGDRSDTVTVRIDPGPPGERKGPQAVLLEMGPLRVHIAGGTLTAISTQVADKVYRKTFAGAITPAKLAELLPPLLLPQLAIVNPEDERLSSPFEVLRGVAWSDAVVDESARPMTVTMRGKGSTGSIALTSLVSTMRLSKVSATVKRAGAEMQVDMTVRSVEPGDPARWAIATEGRQEVAYLTELRPTPRPLEIPGGPPPPQ
ncbi:MAG: hypothetical protein KF678_09260 [Phycisphaeraceae bacterium]|nr:hypothetical protein [Phycisphaeraceae bacterium]